MEVTPPPPQVNLADVAPQKDLAEVPFILVARERCYAGAYSLD